MEHLDHPSPHVNDTKMARFCSFAPSWSRRLELWTLCKVAHIQARATGFGSNFGSYQNIKYTVSHSYCVMDNPCPFERRPFFYLNKET